MQIIQETVTALQIGEPVVHQQMAMFPLLGQRADGEELVGAKQNRPLSVSILAPPKQEKPIPVSCVERGGWWTTS